MTPIGCTHDRVVHVSAKCSDQCSVNYGDGWTSGYVPGNLGIGGGDYIEFKLCLDCRRIL